MKKFFSIEFSAAVAAAILIGVIFMLQGQWDCFWLTAAIIVSFFLTRYYEVRADY